MENLQDRIGETRPEQDRERRRLLFWVASGIVVFALFFCCGQLAIMLQGVPIQTGALSQMESDYSPWPITIFAPLNPAIMGELGLLGQPAFSPDCFILAPGCTLVRTPTPTFTSTASPTPSPSPIPTDTATATLTSTATYTLIPSATPTITFTPSNTPTPTPQVYPIKLADQLDFPPGSWTVQFDIIVINYGSIPPAELTTVIDRLPPGMTLVPGSCNPSGCTTSVVGGRQVITWNLNVNIPQGGFYRLDFRASVEGTSAGDVLTNEVETQGDNFQTAVNYRTVYVYTATPSPTVTVVPGAVNDSAVTNEDVAVDIDVLANDTGLRDTPLTVSIQSAPGNGSAVVLVNNQIRYSPAADYYGGDSFVYRVTDADGQFDSASVMVTINSVNDTPSAVDDSATTPEDIPINIAVLANDTGIGDTPLSVVVIGAPSNGSAVVQPNNTITYTPALNYDGPDSFSYRVTDVDGQSDTALVSITVTPPINDPPVAQDDGPFDFVEDSVDNVILHQDLLSNDTDVENDPLTAVLFSGPTYGTVLFNDNGTPADSSDDYFTYTPTPNYFGPDSVSYRAFDGTDYSNVATVSINVSGVNDTPLAVDDFATSDEDVPVALDVIDYASGTNDTGATDLPITVSIISGPSNGTVAPLPSIVDASFPPDATFTYTPNPDWFGVDTFEYQICDADTPTPECDTATVTITVNPVNDPPVAVNDNASMNEDGEPITINVVANDTDADGFADIDPTSVTIVATPTPGTAVNNGDGTITYTPDSNFFGQDSFTYQVQDFQGALSNVATVTIDVIAQNDDPNAQNDVAHTSVGQAVDIYVLSNDAGLGDTPLTVTLVAPNPSDGSAAVIGSPGLPGGIYIRYTPDPAFYGSDTFGYQVCDADAPTPQCDTATVQVFINDPPTANDDPGNDTPEDTPITVNVLANDVDVDDGLDTSSVVIQNQPTNGTAVVDPGGTITYTPDPNYFGSDSLEYTVDDLKVPAATSNYATVSFNVISVNDPPVAADDAYSTDENTLLSVSAPGVLGNDSDVDVGDSLSANLLSGPASAAAFSLNSDGSFSYLPNSGFYGIDSFTYEACDLASACDPATVTIDVNGAPTAVDDGPYDVNEDGSLNIPAPGVLANDSDPESDPLQALLVSGTTNGNLSLNSNGSFSYTPFADYHGPDSFTYRANDGSASSNGATVSINVISVDDIPIALDDSASVDEDGSACINVLANDTGLGDPPVTVALESPPSEGSASVGAPCPANQIAYSPNSDYFGSDALQYRVTDDDGQSDVADVDITVNSVNDPPTAVDDGSPGSPFDTNEDTPVVVDVASNDFDLETFVDPATVQVSSGPSNGSAVSNGDGTVTYTPDPNYFGSDSFSYTIQDADPSPATSNVATVYVNVIPLNDPPQANNDSANTDQGVPVTINVAGNDTDPDGNLDATSVAVVGLPSNGGVVNNGDGTITYSPNVGPFTSDSFTYEIQDTLGLTSNIATVTVNINPPVLGIVKDANPSSASIGDTIDFIIYIWNDGPGIAYSLQLTDTLGSCFSWVSADPSGPLGDLDVGGAVVRVAIAQVVADTACDNTNSVSVTSVNGASANAWVSVSLAGSGSGSGFSTPTPPPASAPSPTATPTATPTPVPPTSTDTSTPPPSPTDTATPPPSPTPTATPS